ncbi:MAG: hypothetical protein JNJ77_13035 [Planctomycetia bacterium]|nr:hypothetical protein [Planctomycetia bacterium]
MQTRLNAFFRRILITVTSVVVGWLVSIEVGIFLKPVPVFEVTLKPRQTIRFMFDKLMVDSPDRTVICYDLHDWKEHVINGDFWTTTDKDQRRMIHDQKIAPTQTESNHYFTFSHEAGKRDITRYVTFDANNRTFSKFHGFDEDDRFETVQGQLHRNYRACVIRRPLPFSSVLSDYFMPCQSPASLIANQVWALQPVHAPCLHSVVSIPDKHVLSQFVLDGRWCYAEIAISLSGKYVVCNRREPSPTDGMMIPFFFMKLWDAQQHRWLSTIPEQLISASSYPAMFLRDQLVLVPLPYSPAISNDCFQLINSDTGIILDQLNRINADFFIKSQNVTDQQGNLVYLKRGGDPLGIRMSLMNTNDFNSNEELAEHFWYSQHQGMLMMQGQQSVIFDSNNWKGIVEWLRRVFPILPSISLGKPLTGIHDWQSQTTHYPWNGSVHMQRSESGKYLLVVHDYDPKNPYDRKCLAQVFLMPMKFHSPLRSLGTGVLAGIVCLFLLVYLLNRRHITQNASSSPTVA